MYDGLADIYDIMTKFDNKWSKKDELWDKLVSRYKPKRVLDFGCASGFHSILLGGLGLEVIGIDSSEGMVKKANSNLAYYSKGSDVRFIHGGIDSLSGFGEFSWVLCFGNTLAHFSMDELVRFFSLSYAALESGGVLWIQLLNYHKILKERKRLVNITGDSANTFIRFYDFLGDSLRFNIISVKRDGGSFSNEWFSNELNPITIDQLRDIFNNLGLFSSVDYYSDLKGSTYIPGESNNLTILAHK
jgi:SAM-dependent methyltransferase